MSKETRRCEAPGCQAELHRSSRGTFCRYHHGQNLGRRSHMYPEVREAGAARLAEIRSTPEGRERLMEAARRGWADKERIAMRGLSSPAKRAFREARSLGVSIEKSAQIARAVDS